MGADKHEKERRKERLPPFVPLLIDTLDQPAWRALSHGARSLYVALKRRYNVKVHNNGRGNTLEGHKPGANDKNLYYGLSPTKEKTDYSSALGDRFVKV